MVEEEMVEALAGMLALATGASSGIGVAIVVDGGWNAH